MNEQAYDNTVSRFERVLTQHYPDVQWYVYRMGELPNLEISILMGAPEYLYVRAKDDAHPDGVTIRDVALPKDERDELQSASFANDAWLNAVKDV